MPNSAPRLHQDSAKKNWTASGSGPSQLTARIMVSDPILNRGPPRYHRGPARSRQELVPQLATRGARADQRLHQYDGEVGGSFREPNDYLRKSLLDKNTEQQGQTPLPLGLGATGL